MAMIENWRLYDGVDRNYYICRIFPRELDMAHKLENWFINQNAVPNIDYEVNFRFNSGYPYYEIQIFKFDLAPMFLLAFDKK